MILSNKKKALSKSTHQKSNLKDNFHYNFNKNRKNKIIQSTSKKSLIQTIIINKKINNPSPITHSSNHIDTLNFANLHTKLLIKNNNTCKDQQKYNKKTQRCRSLISKQQSTLKINQNYIPKILNQQEKQKSSNRKIRKNKTKSKQYAAQTNIQQQSTFDKTLNLTSLAEKSIKQYQSVQDQWKNYSINVLKKTSHKEHQNNLHEIQINFYIDKITNLQRQLKQKDSAVYELRKKINLNRNIPVQSQNKRLKQERQLLIKQNQVLKSILKKFGN